MNEPKPLLAVTMGDPAGIGPEVIVRAWKDERVHAAARLLVVGHTEMIRRAARLWNDTAQVVEIASTADLSEFSFSPRLIPCLHVGGEAVLDCQPGHIDPVTGEAAYQAVRTAAHLAIERHVDGLVTAPLSKSALHAAGHGYPGHTELLAELCGVNDFAMMLYLEREQGSGNRDQGGLGVVHVTLHQSLRRVFADLSTDAIVAKCRLIDGVMRRLGVAQPRVAVCALNPHAGEDGLFGDEEGTIIAPAVDAARREGMDVAGPFPADTLMVRARDGEFDAIVAMYHDQGHIAVKLMGMQAAVNITLGLPIVRTSVAHGTAFDRAWQGTAHSEGMVAAILTAAGLTRSK